MRFVVIKAEPGEPKGRIKIVKGKLVCSKTGKPVVIDGYKDGTLMAVLPVESYNRLNHLAWLANHWAA